MLRDHVWQLKFTPESGDLVERFYIPVLEDAERYDRLTGYFSAGALALAARGIEGLVRRDGRMRLLVGCTLDSPEIEAIERGEALRTQVEKRLTSLPLAPADAVAASALELLAWMVAHDHLDVKVAVPCDASGKPISDEAIFHEKSGIVQDCAGNRVAWTGSLNETAAGWRRNWESISVYTSWGPEPDRVNEEESNFARLWADQARHVTVLRVPEAVRRDLMRFLPKDVPGRLRHLPVKRFRKAGTPAIAPRSAVPALAVDRRSLVWTFLAKAPGLEPNGACFGEATAAVTPWPHQVRAFQRLYTHWPPKLLIADEVGLGKTIQAGMLLRQAWLSGRAERILILAPKAVLRQWQIELREKFNLNWPIYDGRKLVHYPSPALRGSHERETAPDEWHKEPVVIASSHLMRRKDRARELLEQAESWDLVLLDEAHHARRHAPGTTGANRPNMLLRLMRGLREGTEGLILLTATPMQVHPVEIWDLLNLLGLPPEWTESAFLGFFEDLAHPSPSAEALERMARLFQAAERHHGHITEDAVRRLTGLSPLHATKVLRALRDDAGIPRRRLETKERRAALTIMQSHTPVRHLVSRHTRKLLRNYFASGRIDTPIAERRVEDRFLAMTDRERDLYQAVQTYIASTYNKAAPDTRSAVGFVMTIYRRRLASSIQALRATLERHLAAIEADGHAELLGPDDDDAVDAEADEETLDADEVADLERETLVAEERSDIEHLLDRIRACPPDSKHKALADTLASLREGNHGQAMVFTQYTDTMDFLRAQLLKDSDFRLMCFSGRGGELPSTDGTWRPITRDDVKRRFRDGEADVLLCTDAAAEGLNFQFCGALINYDMPWNPMRVEQRIGRIDRLGQRHPVIRIINLHYVGTVEADVYQALRDRIGLFEQVVGRLQPILAQVPRSISAAVLAKVHDSGTSRAEIGDIIDREARHAEADGFDIDAVLDSDLKIPKRPPSPVTMHDLDQVIRSSDLMPPGTSVQPMGLREYGLRGPGMNQPVRVTTDPGYYDQHAESIELWSPGNPLFQPPDLLTEVDEPKPGQTLNDILNSDP